MKHNKFCTFQRLLVFCLILAVIITGSYMTVLASEPAFNNRTIVIVNEDGDVKYQNEQDNLISNLNTEELTLRDDLIIEPGYDGEPNSHYPLPRAMGKVSNTTVTPYKNVCYVEAVFPNGEIWGSSGILVFKNVVLCSAHGLYNPERGGYATKVTVYPGVHNTSNGGIEAPEGSAEKTTMRMALGYVNEQLIEYDWALVDLDRNFNFWQDYGYAPDYSKLEGRTVSAIGYPNEYNYDMYQQSGTIKDAFEKTLHISVETLGGQSGGPIIDENTGAVIGLVHGMHNGIIGINKYNVSVRIDEYLFNIIKNHIAEKK